MRKQVILFAAASIFAAAACKKNNGSGSNLRIEDFRASAPRDSVLEIWGHGFGKTPAENIVSFLGTMGTVVGASDTMLRVKVPRLAPSGRVTVKAHGETAVSDGDFTYVFTVSTFAGSGKNGGDIGTGASASFHSPMGLCTDAAGNVYVADSKNAAIRKITPDGTVSYYAGGKGGLTLPTDVAIDKAGNMYVADAYQDGIFTVSSLGEIKRLVGYDTSGYKDGKGSAALLNHPFGICLDKNGNIIVADTYNHRIRKVTPDGTVTTIAGSGKEDHVDGAASSAAFEYPVDVAVAPDGSIYVADGDYTIRKISLPGIVSTMAGSTGHAGYLNGQGSKALLGNVTSIIVDEKGLVYFTDDAAEGVRTMDALGNVARFTGDGVGQYRDGLQYKALFNDPTGIVKTADGTIYVAETYAPRIRKID